MTRPVEDERLDELSTPASSEAEAAVLGSLMLCFDERMALCRRAGLTVADFFFAGHRAAYREMVAHEDELHDCCDPLTLVGYLRESGDLERLNGPAGVGELTGYGIAGQFGHEPCERYIRKVKELSRRRALGRQAYKTLADIADGERGVGEIANEVQRFAADLQSGQPEAHPTAAQLIDQSLTELEMRKDLKPRGVRSGWHELDAILGGLHPGHLCVLAARPRIGKSTFAIQWLLHRLAPDFIPLVISFEMTGQEIINRMLMIEAQMPGVLIRSGDLSSDDWRRQVAAADRLRVCPLHIRDQIRPTLMAVSAEAWVMRREVGLDFLVIDYVQLMSGGGENRVQDLSEITRGLKMLARDLEVPILCLAQLNRAIEGRGNTNPRLSDLRESGSIEQDADQVIFLTRDLESEADVVDAQIIVEKNRHGRNGKVRVEFDRRVGGFIR